MFIDRFSHCMISYHRNVTDNLIIIKKKKIRKKDRKRTKRNEWKFDGRNSRSSPSSPLTDIHISPFYERSLNLFEFQRSVYTCLEFFREYRLARPRCCIQDILGYLTSKAKDSADTRISFMPSIPLRFTATSRRLTDNIKRSYKVLLPSTKSES